MDGTEIEDAGKAVQKGAPAAKLKGWLGIAILLLAVLLPSLLVCAFREGSNKGSETTNDGYYHIAMADKGPLACLARSFPNITLSTWNAHFSDKELGYHLYLWAVRKIEKALGLDMGPPFHFAGAFSLLLAFGGFAFACRRLGVHPLIALIMAFAMTLLAVPFLFRLMMVRPHLLAIGFMLASCGLYAKGSLRFRAVAAFLIAFAFTWSYSNPHFIIIPALAFGIALSGEFGWRRAMLIPALSAAGFVAGLIIHPQFPNSLIMWKAQCVDAVLWPILLDSSPINKPAEMFKPSTNWIFLSLPLLALLYLELMALIGLKERGGLRAIPASVKALALLAALFLAASAMASRAIEYLCPFACLLGAVLAEGIRSGELQFKFKMKPGVAMGTALAILSVLFLFDWHELRRAKGHDWLPCPGVAAWLRANAEPGSVVANVNWGDFPMLFYSAPEYHYIWGMDPMFTYAYDPKAAIGLDKICRSRPAPAPSELHAICGAKYAVALDPAMMRELAISGWKLLYRGDDGWIFDLEEPLDMDTRQQGMLLREKDRRLRAIPR